MEFSFFFFWRDRDMKSFFWKFFICIVPCLLAGWVTTDATIKYRRGDSGGFKLGVDLVGGTILVYEIDLRKSQDTDDKNKFDPAKDTSVLAESLKRRIDPNDLYNITIRPAGGEGRIEIILPTGGAHRARKADRDWGKLLETMNPAGSEKLEVGRGKVQSLADLLQTRQVEKEWRVKLFNNKAAWDRLLKAGLEYWAFMDNSLPKDSADRNRYLAVPVGDLDGFSKFVLDYLARSERHATTPKTIKNWIKKQAWEEALERVRDEYKLSADHKTDMSRIVPDNTDQLTTYVLSKGVIISQSALALIKPLVGEHLDRVFEGKGDPTDTEVRKFVRDIYGKPLQEIKDSIFKEMEATGFTKDLSVEEVQRIKDLVSKVGSLEFNILANGNDDDKGIKDATDLVNFNTSKDELAELQTKGIPPPVPRVKLGGGKSAPQIYTIKTAVPGVNSTLTYRWIELGPQERRSLNLDNAARVDPSRNAARTFATTNKNKALKYPEIAGSADRHLLQGALFFCRDCNDSNLPEEERKLKEVEYFVLAREPEFTNETAEDRTPKIDGSYLRNAYGAPGSDLRPTVHFTFNEAGGILFGELTRKNVSEGSGPENTQKRRHLAIVLDGMVMSAPTINSQIRTQGQISGNFTQKEVDSLVNILRAGRLPATLKPQPVSESTIAATLGEDTIVAGVQAIMLAFAAVLAFMCAYYRFAGVVASIALLANLLLTIGFMVAVQATFTLSGLAGVVLTLGMAVDANVLIYERLREERERGASLLQAIRNGYDRALPTIIDTHLSSIFTAIVLYVVGNDNLKGFAISMTVGLVISLFTSLYMTRVMFDYCQGKGWLTNLTMMRLFGKPNLDFMSIRNLMFTITIVVSIAGAALFIGRLPNDLNIDFVGGTAYGGKLTKGLTVKMLREQVDEKRQKTILAGVVVTEEEPGRKYTLTYPHGDKSQLTVMLSNSPDGKTPEERIAAMKKRASYLPDPGVELLYNATEDPEVQKELLENKSRNFVIRTTEKEPELVQTILDQLLRLEIDGKIQPLLSKASINFSRLLAEDGKTVAKSDTLLSFYDFEDGTKKLELRTLVTASPSFVKTLFNRELRRAFGITDDKETLPFVLEVTPEGSSDSDGKFKAMRVGFGSSALSVEYATKIEEALQHTQEAFSRRPLPDRLENFDSALANETRYRAMWAVLASWAAILVYLWFRFGNWTFGIAAVLCLIHDLCFTLGAIAVCHYLHGTFIGDLFRLDDFKLDLPSVAALLTLVGYSVNDTIVVFDRIREVRGKNPDLTFKMLNDSVNQTLSRTVLASLTVWLVVVVLYWFGGPGVHLFAFVMVVGVIVGTYSSIYIAAPLLVIFGEGKHEDEIANKQVAPAPNAEGTVV